MMPSRLLAFVAALASAPLLLAQAPPPAPGTSPAPEAGSVPANDTIKSIIDQELQPDPTGYSYSPQGRRDPFVSLLKPVSADQGARTRRPGMEGFLIQEVALKGIVRTPKGFTAMLLGTDGKSYFVNVGQRLFDGVIVSIDATTVTLRQEVSDPLSTVKSRDVRKTLYPTEEARQ
jgi:Tfp pilus assembly protein PilP